MFYDEPVILDGDRFDFHTTNIRLALPEPKTSEINESAPSVEKKTFRLPKFPAIHKPILKIGSGLLILAATIIVISMVQNAGSVHKFEFALEKNDYALAYEIYQGYDSGSKAREKANDVLMGLPNELTTMYADGTITYDELTTSLDALSAFSFLERDIPVARKVGEELYASRQAYEAGTSQDVPSDRLMTWKAVLKADGFSYVAVQSNLAKNKDFYKDSVFAEIQDCLDSGLYRRAYVLAETLSLWYPDDTAISEKFSSLEAFANSKGDIESSCPVKVNSLKVSSPDINNYVDLMISWENISSKAITEVKFYIVPYNSLGKPVADKEHGYSEFCAIDSRRYEPGDSSPTGKWGWANVWKNPFVETAGITRIEVTFADGVKKNYENFSNFT